jgi:hypothetical protein
LEIEEVWKLIPDFVEYQISNLGRVYNIREDRIMSTSVNNHGHVKISLKEGHSSRRHTRSVALMVAEAFVEPSNWMCDHVIVLDGDFSNVVFFNLAWRPRWFAWKYTRQLKVLQPVHYRNLIVQNVNTGFYYDSIVEAGMTEGLLFDDIWRSTYTSDSLFPYGHIFKIIERV